MGHDTGVNARMFQRILQSQCVEDRSEHAHVVGGRAIHALAAGGQAPPDVAPADYHGHLHAFQHHCESDRRAMLQPGGRCRMRHHPSVLPRSASEALVSNARARQPSFVPWDIAVTKVAALRAATVQMILLFDVRDGRHIPPRPRSVQSGV